MAKIKMLTSFYLLAHKRRQEWANWKWRLFAILVTLIIMLYVNDYLQRNYYTAVSFVKPGGGAAAFVLADKLFYWFATGVIIGLVAMALIYEGEFMLALLKFARGIESEFNKDARTVGKGIRDAERLVEREVERGAESAESGIESGVDLITPAWTKKLRAAMAKAKKQGATAKTKERKTKAAGKRV
jgi:hypothetical protein